MRTYTLLIALLAAAFPAPAVAQAPTTATTTRAAAAEVPATVLEHRETVSVDSARRMSRTVSWTVRVDDPSGCAAGLIAPAGLDGASSRGATVLEGDLILPGDAAAGDTYTLTATTRGPQGGHSGVFATAPDLPVVSAVFEVRAAATLHVWF